MRAANTTTYTYAPLVVLVRRSRDPGIGLLNHPLRLLEDKINMSDVKCTDDRGESGGKLGTHGYASHALQIGLVKKHHIHH